jgi:CRISPR-associated protein Csx3
MELFPAILIGGPPHSGKSVLAYSLSQRLRQLGLAHYLLRACPDGEGDWANEIDQSLTRLLRVKGHWTPALVERVCRDIAGRHLPLLVDVGGRPEPWQEPILAHCTHALLLASRPEELTVWQDYARRYGLPILAELQSSLTGPAELYAEGPVFQARLAGLERGSRQSGPVFEALVQKLSPYLAYPDAELRRLHLTSAPVQTTIDLDRLAPTLGVPLDGRQARWEPVHLPRLLDELPTAEPLGLYGRGPNWLYTAAALQTHPAPFSQFDPRLGWVSPPELRSGPPPPEAELKVRPERHPAGLKLDFTLSGAFLDYDEAPGLIIPPAPAGEALILSGKLPLWLFTALGLAYRAAPLLAVYQPKLKAAVVVASTRPDFWPGDVLPDA